MTDQQKRIYWNRNWQFLKGFEESYLGLQTIDAAQELEQVESYLKIQLLRYAGQFTYQIENQAEPGALFLRFTLQPIVENAIYHGVKGLAHQGIISILVKR